jgi:hypothetical protein
MGRLSDGVVRAEGTNVSSDEWYGPDPAPDYEPASPLDHLDVFDPSDEWYGPDSEDKPGSFLDGLEPIEDCYDPEPACVTDCLGSDARNVFSKTLDAIATQRELGRGAWKVLRVSLVDSLQWAEQVYNPEIGPFLPFAEAVAHKAAQRFFTTVSSIALRKELRDEKQRDRAAKSDDALVKFVKHWRRRMHGLRPVPGRTSAELFDELEVELIRALRDPEMFTRYEGHGRIATWEFLSTVRTRLYRTARKIYEVSRRRGPKIDPDTIGGAYVPTPEDVLSAVQRPDGSERASRLIEQIQVSVLSKRQLMWWQRIERVFRDSVARQPWRRDVPLNLAEVADRHGSHRAAPARALGHVRRVLRRLAKQYDS